MSLLRSVSVVVIAVVAAALPAAATDHFAPDAVVRTGGDRQVGINYHAEWPNRTGKYCSHLSGDGPYEFPEEGLAFTPGAKARVRFWKRQKPTEVTVHAWQTLDSAGHPAGPAEEVSFELRPHRRYGRTAAWDAIFFPVFATDYYVDATGEWVDVDGCGDALASFTFHLHTDPAAGE